MPVSNPMLAAKVSSATPSAAQRAAAARVLPSASTSAPPNIGSQINTLNKGQFDTCS
jgi:hypothetical protein